MMAYAYAPKNAEPPDLFVRWTWAKEMGVPWERLGIQDSELGHLAELISIKNGADELKARAHSKGHAKSSGRTI